MLYSSNKKIRINLFYLFYPFHPCAILPAISQFKKPTNIIK
ncbi:hypothetical protein FEM08_06660 [Flavobacterium gilvum]|nr:hypothetical protein FEM08_06660 [Flavobacterium gilvum]